MKINLIAVGKLKEPFFTAACAEYLKRLSRYAEITVREIAEEQCAENPAAVEQAKKKEGERIACAVRGKLYLLAVKGTEVSSEELAAMLKEDVDAGRELSFVIGGSYGTSERLGACAAKQISFGRITLPHRLMRVVFLEQLYRAFTIINGSGYHK